MPFLCLRSCSYVHWVFVFLLLQLDEKACVVLKNLLDGATERVFEAHSKVDCLLYVSLMCFSLVLDKRWIFSLNRIGQGSSECLQ